ncbi:CPBP family intramembrane glutamic endopeptidase [Fusibacter ferrireducens]|uniref:CPBP family intramembrane metalloprotease n=1 Tax=Fusibacter ferrireducens TaxID=2785058 RepID=A0ABR9ZPK9_9FIRM|nr:type II CAAX endopeptidase family protein [Fusibacter ferrireducens]MBF4691921.1 CPBP family intramembrane metalloprotease [Fusibacter ferrireducens]
MDKNQLKLIHGTLSSKLLLNFILAPILAIVFIFVGQTAGYALFLLMRLDLSGPTLSMMLFMALTCGMTIVMVFIWVHFIERRSLSSLGLYRSYMLIHYIQGFAIGFLMFLMVMCLLFVTRQMYIVPQPHFRVGILALPIILAMIPVWMIQGASEEILTRGWLMNTLIARYNLPLGVILSSTLFGLLHLLNTHVSYIAILNIVLIGVFFGLYALKTENLWGACGAHSAWNWAQGNIFGLEVSGNTMNASLFQTKLIGPDLITGGAFGPEGGFAVSIVIIIGILIVYRLPWRQTAGKSID